MTQPDEHPVKRVNADYFVCETCGNSGSERWALRHQFPPDERATDAPVREGRG